MIKLRVCIGTSCHINGANNIVMTFQHLMEEYRLYDKIDFSASFCTNKCSNRDVSVRLNDEEYRVSAENAREFFREKILPLTK